MKGGRKKKPNKIMKIFTGKVISTKMKNTATVSVDSTFMHKLYGKRFIKSKKYHVHDEFGSQVGDTVKFVASKPFSKIKKWKILGADGVVKNKASLVHKEEGKEAVKSKSVINKKKSTRKI